MCVNNLPRVHLAAEQPGIELATYRSLIQRPTTTPPSHLERRYELFHPALGNAQDKDQWRMRIKRETS